jgi:hypothetical protein
MRLQINAVEMDHTAFASGFCKQIKQAEPQCQIARIWQLKFGEISLIFKQSGIKIDPG